MDNDIMKIFEEFVEDYVPETEEEKKEDIPSPEQQAAEETAKREQKERDREKQAWIKNAKEKRDAAFKMITAKAERVMKKQTDLIDYLTVQAHFDRYPVRNCLLIASQLPGATRLKSFDEWKDESKKIKKGAKAVTILEPGDEYQREDGSVGRYYNTRALFDISQVTGGKYQPPTDEPDMANKLRILFKTVDTFDVKPCSYGENGGRAAFFQAGSKSVYVNKSASLEILYPQLCVELAHTVISNNNNRYTRKQYGSICEMVGYILCVRNNVNVPADAIPLRIAPEYEELKEKKVINILEEVRGTANTLSRIMQTLKEQKGL